MDQDELLRQLIENNPINVETLINGPIDLPISSVSSTSMESMEKNQQLLVHNVNDNNNDIDEFVDETFIERILALKEMFPEPVQQFGEKLNHLTSKTSKLAYKNVRSASWWCMSSFSILIFPILVQKELLQVAQQIAQEQRSLLLGPQATIGGASAFM